MTTLDDIADVERPVMHDAAQQLGLDTSGSRLVSASSRLIWHLPVDQVALTVTRPGSKTADDIVAEAAAVRSATGGGVRTPNLLAEPIELADARFALPYRWIDGRAFESTDWQAGVAEAAKLARCEPEGLRQISWPTDWPHPAWEVVLGQRRAAEFGEHLSQARRALTDLVSNDDLVLGHGDLHPANLLVDGSGTCWLIDLEYAGLYPPVWDAAKVVLLARRFNDPVDANRLLGAWPLLESQNLTLCVMVQEVRLVAWLVEMARRGAPNAGGEAIRRASSLRAGVHRTWSHLPT